MSKKAFFIVLLVLISFGLLILGYFFIKQKIIDHEQQIAQEPAQLEAIELVDKACENCFSMSYLLSVLKQEDVVFKRIRQLDINSEEGQALKDQYKVTKVPIMLITGEIDKNQDFLDLFKGFGEDKGNVLISDVYPPYKDLKTNQIVGLVDLTVIYDSTCTECYNTKKHLDFLKAEGIEPVSEKKLDVSSEEAQQLIAKYNITKVPTIILSPAAKNYKIFTEHWQEVGKVADDGFYIYTAPEKIGTYKDLIKNEIIKVQLNN
jgi:predicted DCC family thiol-disulfide oxidoreductase YuxK